MDPQTKLQNAISTVKSLPEPNTAEVCGLWLWVEFPTKPSSDTRQTLKDNGFKWASKKEKWYFAAVPGGSRRAMPMDYIRMKYGSTDIESPAPAL